ncbi:MAG: hypothetical protein IPK04_04080 [Bdellovibrionales bacterium]|nr:hypothetical protein [Bdellovibrionales bacterium]
MTFEKEKFDRIVRAALRSPSGDNCQPFAFVVNGLKIQLHFIPERAKHIFDSGKLGSALALGVYISSVKHAAAIEGYGTKIELGDLEDRPSVWAEITLIEGCKEPSEFSYEILEKRETNRAVYNHQPLPSEFRNWLKKQAGVFFVETPPEGLLAHAEACEEIMWKNPMAIRDVFQWIHFFKRSYEKARSGMHVEELGVNLTEIPSIWLSKKIPSFPSLIYKPMMKSIVIGLLRRSLMSASALVVVTQQTEPTKGLGDALSRKELRHRFVETGRRGMDIWLMATKFGMTAQPVTLSIIPYFWAQDSGLGFEFSDHLRGVALAGPAAYRQDFQFGSELVPAWGLRIGFATRHKQQRSLRLA